MKSIFIFFLTLPSLLLATGTVLTIRLLNDTPFTLTAVVQGADGSFLGQAEYQPGQQNTFVTTLTPTDVQTPGYYDIARSPYTVVWKCANGGFYSVCPNVSPASLVAASSCPQGNYFCQPKEEKKKSDCKGCK
jgi:hypothetical protein